MTEAASSMVSGIKSTLTFMATATEHQQNDQTNEEQNQVESPAPASN